jgi:putative ABC transport system permease protein
MFTALSLLTLAIGIGANTAMFSVINGVLLRPLPYPHPEQLVALWHTAPGVNIENLNMAPSLYFTYSSESRVFQDVSMWTSGTSSVTGIAEPEEVPTLFVTHRLLPIIEVKPAIGRGFTATDENPKQPEVALLADGYWRSRFGADPSVIGRRITIEGKPTEIIGVLPATFQFMDRRVSLMSPLRFNPATLHLGGFSYQGLARLKPEATLAQANADVARMLPIDMERFPAPPGFNKDMFKDARIGPNLRFMKDDLLGDIGNTLWVLMGTVGIVLLIACANVANLLLVRAEGRQQELAVRAALGAGWGRIARELLMESLALGLTGGALGLGLAYGALRLLGASEFTQLPRLDNVSIDLRAVLFTVGAAIVAAMLFGLIPVFKYARPQLALALRSSGRSLSTSRDRQRARNVLVVVQVALALVLLVSSGLLIRTFQALRNVDPGFSNPDTVQTIGISLLDTVVKEPEHVVRMHEAILRKIEALPGVTSVAVADSVPMEGGWGDPVYAEDQVYAEGTLPPLRRFRIISPGYVATIGSRLVAGRDITWNETFNHVPVALVSESMARELWREPQAALGKRIRPTVKDDWREVIGVVADLRDNGVDQKAPTTVYWPLYMTNFMSDPVYSRRGGSVLVRSSRAGSLEFLGEVRRAVWSVNANLPVANPRTLGAVYDRSMARTQFTLVMLVIAGSMALLLGIVGIYGVISYSVSQRTREIGIRLALGAPLGDVRRMFLRHGLVLSAIGAACGLAAAFALTRLMKTLLFEVNPTDPITYVLASAGLIGAAMLASYLPARSASAVDPAHALRSE